MGTIPDYLLWPRILWGILGVRWPSGLQPFLEGEARWAGSPKEQLLDDLRVADLEINILQQISDGKIGCTSETDDDRSK